MKMYQVLISIVLFAFSANVIVAGADTEFTYQGRLLDAGEPATGTFDVEFRLWDAPAGGGQFEVTNTFDSLPILEGLFTVELDFGANAFDNNDRWLEVIVDGVPLLPRQPITRAPYAIQTRGIFVDDDDNIGIGTNTPNFPLHIESAGATVVYARNTTSSGPTYGGQFVSDSASGRGVYGLATATSDSTTYGGQFASASTSGRGVFGEATAPTSNSATYGGYFASAGTFGYGVYGLATATSDSTTYGGHFASNSTSGRGVYGVATSTTGVNFGGRFESASTSGAGVSGRAFADTGTGFGGYFESNGTSGLGVYGVATAGTGDTYGVYGQSNSTSGLGVYGGALAGGGTTYGVYGQSNSTSGRGVFGVATAGTGTTYGGRFESDSTSGFAGYFDGQGNDAVYVVNAGTGRGLHAVAPSDTAVWAQTTTGFAGVHGANAATSGRGVYGEASASTGINYGVFGASNSASGYDFFAGGAGVNYGASSSRRWKSNIVPIADPLVKLAQLRGVYFDWDDEHGGAHDVGMIAEEVGAVLPEIVQYEDNGLDASGMDYSKLTPLLVEAVNALHAENSDLRAANKELQQRFTRLESLVSRLTTENN